VNIFKDIALTQVPRIIGFLNRTEKSHTYGCFDRNFWHYKLIDFPNLRFQEAAFLLSLLYQNNFPGNQYYNRQRVLLWCASAVRYWANRRNRNGSVNEVYPYEHSYCATAMSACAVFNAILISPTSEMGGIDVERTGDFLATNSNIEVTNQEAAAALALYQCANITEKSEYSSAARSKVSNIISHQHKSGFYPEYGGFDVGYQSITVSLLSRVYLLDQSDTLRKSIESGIHFCECRISENGTFDNSNTTRKTQFLYPLGFARFESNIIRRITKGLISNQILNPAWLDDRYVIPLTIDYLLTYLTEQYGDDNHQVDTTEDLQCYGRQVSTICQNPAHDLAAFSDL